MKAVSRRYLHAGLALSSIVLSAAGQLGMKAGMHALANASAMPTPVPWYSSGVVTWTAAGLGCYGVSLLAWLVALTRYPLSLIYPLLGLSYVLVYLGATHWPYLMEPSSPQRGVGTALIAIGVAIVCVSRDR